MKPNAGPLEKIGLRVKEEDGEAWKKSLDAQSQILANIGSTTSSAKSDVEKQVFNTVGKVMGW